MAVLLKVEDARKIVSGSNERKCDLIEKMNASIKSQAEIGLRWCHLPNDTSEDERNWLKEELTLQGYTVKDSNPAVNW